MLPIAYATYVKTQPMEKIPFKNASCGNLKLYSESTRFRVREILWNFDRKTRVDPSAMNESPIGMSCVGLARSRLSSPFRPQCSCPTLRRCKLLLFAVHLVSSRSVRVYRLASPRNKSLNELTMVKYSTRDGGLWQSVTVAVRCCEHLNARIFSIHGTRAHKHV